VSDKKYPFVTTLCTYHKLAEFSVFLVRKGAPASPVRLAVVAGNKDDEVPSEIERSSVLVSTT